MSRAALAAAALCLVAACGIPLDEPLGYAAINTCSTAGDCAADATCQQGKCVATVYDLANLLLEVRPQAGSTFGTGTSYVIDPATAVQLVSGPGSQPFLLGFPIHLSDPVSIHGQVLLDPSTALDNGCNFPDLSIPAQLTFFRSRVPQLAGLTFDKVQVSATGDSSAAKPTYAFDVDPVSDPNDRYDVYIEPQAVQGCPTVIPPYFVPNQTIFVPNQTSDAKHTVWRLPPVVALTGTIDGLTDPTSWQVNLVEPTQGLVVSAGSNLDFSIGSAGATVKAQIFSINTNAWPILRLTPVDATKPDPKPVDPSRPTVYWTLQGAVLGTDANPEVNFTVQDLAYMPIDVQGKILGPDGVMGIGARLDLQSQTLQGGNAGNAAFSANAVQTDPTGVFSIGLPPGDYSVRIFPTADNGLSISDRQITWPTNLSTLDCVCGRTFELDQRATLRSTLDTADGRALGSVSVGIAPSQTLPQTYLKNTHSLGPLPARAETTTTDGSGGFSLLADLGTVDLTVQPDPATNLPWLVVPQISPEPGAALRPLALTSPAFLGGTLYDPKGNPVANAQIDAWYPVRNPTNPALLIGTVVKIATTTTDASGAYTLVLPSSVPSRGLK